MLPNLKYSLLAYVIKISVDDYKILNTVFFLLFYIILFEFNINLLNTIYQNEKTKQKFSEKAKTLQYSAVLKINYINRVMSVLHQYLIRLPWSNCGVLAFHLGVSSSNPVLEWHLFTGLQMIHIHPSSRLVSTA